MYMYLALLGAFGNVAEVGGDDKETMLSRVRRVSLEDLRNNYDAVLVSKARLPGSTWETTPTALEQS